MEQNKAKKEIFNISAGIKKKGNSLSIILSSLKKKKWNLEVTYWTFKLLLCPGCCKQCCNEYWGTCVLLNYGFLWIYAQEWDCWVIW